METSSGSLMKEVSESLALLLIAAVTLGGCLGVALAFVGVVR